MSEMSVDYAWLKRQAGATADLGAQFAALDVGTPLGSVAGAMPGSFSAQAANDLASVWAADIARLSSQITHHSEAMTHTGLGFLTTDDAAAGSFGGGSSSGSW